ncbi:MAG: tRNA (N6-threonylcarbamoyladenosine(37)-N6)-methyltransferase TrmO [Desulfovibrio sp.]|nr:MAG: tRNA (N6-threonylcarbamoyladenosine(37)-N6)-methyltransferase TrmO [Desulfovibrio sp.]
MDIRMQPIGVIHSPFATKDECPIQGVYSPESRGRVEVFSEHEAGLQDIETFSHIYLLYLFDRAGKIEYVRKKLLDDAAHGIYASRHPCRPNSIGMSIVELKARQGNILVVDGIDVLDQTPLLDIKPYIPRHDHMNSACEGWIANVEFRPKPPGRE